MFIFIFEFIKSRKPSAEEFIAYSFRALIKPNNNSTIASSSSHGRKKTFRQKQNPYPNGLQYQEHFS